MKKVLVVDDEHLIADTLCRILRQHGYDATPVYCAGEALLHLSTGKPDLMICDVMLPDGMDGVDVAVQCRQLCPSCAILLFSGNAGTQDVLNDAVLRGHQFEILAKPVPPRELLSRIEKMFEREMPCDAVRAPKQRNVFVGGAKDI